MCESISQSRCTTQSQLTAFCRWRLIESIMKASGQLELRTTTCCTLPSLEMRLLRHTTPPSGGTLTQLTNIIINIRLTVTFPQVINSKSNVMFSKFNKGDRVRVKRKTKYKDLHCGTNWIYIPHFSPVSLLVLGLQHSDQSLVPV